jgi:sugar lactone lactonase YvrE
VTARAWTAAPVGTGRHRLGEGPHWDASRGRLSWVDIAGGALWVDQDGTERPLVLGEPLGVAVPHAEGGWVCGLGRAVALVGDDGTVLHRVELEPETVRMNDGKCDPRGRFFVGSKAHDNAAGAGSLWRLALDGVVTKVLDGLTISNGLGWSPDSTTMYVTDSAPGRVDAYDYDLATGELGRRRPFLALPPGEGSPDGLAVDATGDVWVALWGGGEVRRYSPAGEQTGAVRVSSSLVTSCAFVGPALTSLAITTAWDELSDEQRASEPDAGRRYLADVGVAGTAGEPCRVSRSGWTRA